MYQRYSDSVCWACASKLKIDFTFFDSEAGICSICGAISRIGSLPRKIDKELEAAIKILKEVNK